MSPSSHPTPNMDEKISISVKEQSQIGASESKIVPSRRQVDHLSSSFTETCLIRSVEIPLPTFTSQHSYVSPIFIPVDQLAPATQPPNYPGPFRAISSADNFKSATSLSYLSPSFNVGQNSAYNNQARFNMNIPPMTSMERSSSVDVLGGRYISQGSLPNDREKFVLHSFQKAPYFANTQVSSNSKLSYPAQSIPKNHLNLDFNPAGSISQLRSYKDSDTLNSYLTSKRGQPNIYKCATCPAEFSSGQAYGGHMSSHSKTRKMKLAVKESLTQGKKARLSPMIPAENEKAMRGHVNMAKQFQMIKDAEEKKENSTEAETSKSMGA